ncbi:putative RutC family protein yabJ [Glarea lozoyensis 74030]|uniref:Putative RutC family protein yabJ n=1 Tax=Glarea lozoyensis (strain ATCC 74030 / MF5533) TaxID=1104152 RepID=H0ECH1_GLAL7|nr:putative RutC family protein yabJ [Glarea lozoyensis 74030]
MSHLKFYTPPGVPESMLESHHYSQAVRVGDLIQLSGQDFSTGEWPSGIDGQVDEAFINVDKCLKFAGGKGWEQVFKVNSYHIPLSEEMMAAMIRNFRKWMPNHRPLWTCIEVPRLGEKGMIVEIEVQAHDPEGAEKTK